MLSHYLEDTVVGVVTSLRADQGRNSGSTRGKAEEFSLLQNSTQALRPTQPLIRSKTGGLSKAQKG
jgi:hypothetical protein